MVLLLSTTYPDGIYTPVALLQMETRFVAGWREYIPSRFIYIPEGIGGDLLQPQNPPLKQSSKQPRGELFSWTIGGGGKLRVKRAKIPPTRILPLSRNNPLFLHECNCRFCAPRGGRDLFHILISLQIQFFYSKFKHLCTAATLHT